MRRRFALRAVRASVRASRLPAGCQRMTRSEMADGLQRDGGWLAGGRQMLCRTTADGLRWAGGYRAVNWRVDGLQRADGCCSGARGWHAARWRTVCGEMADAVQGAARCCAERRQMACGGRQMLCRVLLMVCGASAGGAQRVEGWCAGSKRMVREGPASCQQKALGGYI